MRSPWFDVVVSLVALVLWLVLRAEGPMTPAETTFVVWAQGGGMLSLHRMLMHGGQR